MRMRLDEVKSKPHKTDPNKIYYNAYEVNQLYDEFNNPVQKTVESVGLKEEAFAKLKKLQGQTVLLRVKVSANTFGGGFPRPSFYDGELVEAAELAELIETVGV